MRPELRGNVENVKNPILGSKTNGATLSVKEIHEGGCVTLLAKNCQTKNPLEDVPNSS